MLALFQAVIFTLIISSGYIEAACTGTNPTLASTPDQASVQSCVNSAINGTTISIASGSATWSSAVSWTDKNISIIGAGIGNTVITRSGGSAFDITETAATQSWRISGMTINGTNPADTIAIASTTTTATKGWRIDHIRFNFSASGTQIFYIQGITWGLIDHCTFDGAPNTVSVIYGYMSSGSDEGPSCSPQCFGYWYWRRAVNLGSDEAVYFEDIDVNYDGSGGSTPVIFDLVYGGSAVIRHSTIDGAYWITHSARSHDRGGMKYEIYNNTWTGKQLFRWASIRSGTGVAFNNTVTDYQNNECNVDGQRESTTCQSNIGTLGVCDGTNTTYDGNIESSGWPCLDQVGRGATATGNGDNGGEQTNTPFYGWKNGSTSTCATGGTCNNNALISRNGCGANGVNYWKDGAAAETHTGGAFDFVNNGDTAKPGYTAYTYPHPLIGGPSDVTPPLAPNNVFISQVR